MINTLTTLRAAKSALEGVLKAHRVTESRGLPDTHAEAQRIRNQIIYAVSDAEKSIVELRALIASMEAQPEQAPFGIWHEADDPDESDFYLWEDSGDVSCEKCVKLYTHAQPSEPKALGLPACPDCHAPDVMYECVWCSATNYPPKPASEPKAEPDCPSCGAPGVMYECIACSASNYPKDTQIVRTLEAEPVQEPLTVESAHAMGAKGATPTEAERLLFEAWMRGHCWAVDGDWNGSQYVHAHEKTGFVHGGAMNTRRLWAAWRDRAALAAPQARKPLTNVEIDDLWGMVSTDQIFAHEIYDFSRVIERRIIEGGAT